MCAAPTITYTTYVAVCLLSTPDDPGQQVEIGYSFTSDGSTNQVHGMQGRNDTYNINKSYIVGKQVENNNSTIDKDWYFTNFTFSEPGALLAAYETKREGAEQNDTPGFSFDLWEIDDWSRCDQSGGQMRPRGTIRADNRWNETVNTGGDTDSVKYKIYYKCKKTLVSNDFD